MTAVELVAVLGLAAAITAPHLLPLHNVTPASAAAVWLAALALRALTALGAAIFAFVYLPQTGVYDAVAHWCWHEALPILATHLGLSGHPLIHAAVVLPGLALALSVLWLLFGLTRGWLLLRARLGRALGDGPHGSTVIEDPQVVVGVTGVGRGRIVVSDGALRVMDSEELEATLRHELAHIRRRHRPLLLVASLLAALGRALPGTRRAERELRFSFERDADAFAVRHTEDPLSLASAICKAAGAASLPSGIGLSDGCRVAIRLDILSGDAPRAGRTLERGARLLGLGMTLLVLALSATLPPWALAQPRAEHALSAVGQHCTTDERARSSALSPYAL